MSPARMCAACLSYRCRCEPVEPAPVECPATIPLALFPTTPPSNGTPTSQAAADSLTEATLNEQQRAVLNALWRYRVNIGLTDEEVCKLTGLNPNAERPRRGELVAGGWVEDSGETRMVRSGRKATIWRVTEKTLRAAEARRTDPEHGRAA